MIYNRWFLAPDFWVFSAMAGRDLGENAGRAFVANIGSHNRRETAGREAAPELIGRFGVGMPSAFVVATEEATHPPPGATGRRTRPGGA
ncbi:hypothetical protein AB0B56_36565 [Streptosporangium canum]|uniref:hypothetical protein n=1 Tax=Streptosporangium canum TaxID=324952 RepID=UPI0034440642